MARGASGGRGRGSARCEAGSLANVEEEFGTIGRIKHENLFRAALGEMWEFIMSPSTTVASYRCSWIALDELDDLLKNNNKQVLELGTKLDEAASAPGNLQLALERSGVSRPDSYLNKGARDDLYKVLDELEKAYTDGSEGWRDEHADQWNERFDHIH